MLQYTVREDVYPGYTRTKENKFWGGGEVISRGKIRSTLCTQKYCHTHTHIQEWKYWLDQAVEVISGLNDFGQ